VDIRLSIERVKQRKAGCVCLSNFLFPHGGGGGTDDNKNSSHQKVRNFATSSVN
jgi:hypothetical protein